MQNWYPTPAGTSPLQRKDLSSYWLAGSRPSRGPPIMLTFGSLVCIRLSTFCVAGCALDTQESTQKMFRWEGNRKFTVVNYTKIFPIACNRLMWILPSATEAPRLVCLAGSREAHEWRKICNAGTSVGHILRSYSLDPNNRQRHFYQSEKKAVSEQQFNIMT